MAKQPVKGSQTGGQGMEVNLGDRAVAIVDSLGRIDLDNLRREVEEAGANSLWWGVLTAQARRRAGEAKLALEIEEGRLYAEHQQAAANRGEKLTVDAIRSLVRLDPRYREAATLHLTAVESAEAVESAKYALVEKARTLQALAGLVMQEEWARRAGAPALTPAGATNEGFPIIAR